MPADEFWRKAIDKLMDKGAIVPLPMKALLKTSEHVPAAKPKGKKGY
jgi:hypothetical protein